MEGHKGEDFTQRIQNIGAYAAAFLAAFLIALVSASAFTPVDNSEAADRISVTQNETGYYLNIATSGNVNMEIQATPDGATAIAKDTVNVVTNSPAYKIYVSMNSSTANTNKLYLNGSTSASSYFSPVSGTTETPAVLGTNTWGWALAGSAISDYGFDNTYTVGANAGASSKFAAMPLIGDEALIASATTATEGTNYDVYYGAKANTALKAGVYSNTVVYTAIGEASSSSSGEASISPGIQTTLDPDDGENHGKGQQVTIATSLYTSTGLDLGTVTAKIGGKECTNVETSFGAGGLVNITCNAPESLTWGTYDVVATFTKFDRSYTIDDAYNVYIPYEEMEDAEAGTYTMQQFTRKTCDEMETPKAYNTQSGSGSILNGDTINTDVPEVTLKDARPLNNDPNDPTYATYRVRKLADGNCWMADNLRLTLSTSTPLTSETSDINYDMDTGRGIDGSTTTPRVISNNLQGTVDPLGTYSTDTTTGVVSWTPFADSQTTGGVSWDSPYVNSSGDMATSGGSTVTSNTKHFGLDGITIETENDSYHVLDSIYAEYARSYDSAGNGQSGAGTGTMNLKIEDGDGNEQYYGTDFNWYAATTGSGTRVTANGGVAQNSICPRNWSLPKGGGDGAWYDLFVASYAFVSSGSATEADPEVAAAQKAPFSQVLSGQLISHLGTVGNRGSRAMFWTSSAVSAANSSILSYGKKPGAAGKSFYTNSDAKRTQGYPVRCVVR